MIRKSLLALTIAIGAMTYVSVTQASTKIPLVKIVRMVSNDDSVKIYITPVLGAADYRVYNPANPHFVKYAGGPGLSASTKTPTWQAPTP